jgi:hypothetical protein
MTLANGGGIIRDPSVLQDFSRGYGVVNVKDYGAVGDGVTDDTRAIQNAMNQILSRGLNVAVLSDHYALGGGGTVVFPNGTYKISQPIALPPLITIEGNMSSIVNVGTGPTFINADTTSLNLSDPNGITIRNLILNGNNTASNGISFNGVVHSNIENVWIYQFVSDGILLVRCQWNHFRQVNSINNGGYGVHLDNSGGNSSGSNDNVFERCKFEANAIGGAYLGAGGGGNAFQGCAFQFHNGASATAGVLIAGGQANSFIGCHFEQNPYHAWINNVNAEGNSFTDCVFIVDHTVCKRFVKNSGTSTTIVGCSSQNDTLQVTNGTNAPYEQDSNNGTMMIVGGFVSNPQSMACYDTGTVVSQGRQNSRVSIMYPMYNGVSFVGTLNFDQYGWGDQNYLMVGDNYLWVDSSGILRIKNTLPTSATDGTPVGAGASVSDIELTSTFITVVNSFTPPAQGNYEIKVYYRVVNAPTNLTVTVTYTDGSGTLQTINLVDGASQPVGAQYVTAFVNATSASPITVTATAGTANNVYVSCSIKPE